MSFSEGEGGAARGAISREEAPEPPGEVWIGGNGGGKS
jgi:hypothetical protein